MCQQGAGYDTDGLSPAPHSGVVFSTVLGFPSDWTEGPSHGSDAGETSARDVAWIFHRMSLG